jgi:hypothetical protein
LLYKKIFFGPCFRRQLLPLFNGRNSCKQLDCFLWLDEFRVDDLFDLRVQAQQVKQQLK